MNDNVSTTTTNKMKKLFDWKFIVFLFFRNTKKNISFLHFIFELKPSKLLTNDNRKTVTFDDRRVDRKNFRLWSKLFDPFEDFLVEQKFLLILESFDQDEFDIDIRDSTTYEERFSPVWKDSIFFVRKSPASTYSERFVNWACWFDLSSLVWIRLNWIELHIWLICSIWFGSYWSEISID